MAMKTAAIFCNHCNAQRLAHGAEPNHILHLLLAVPTAGLWLLVWLMLATTRHPYFCSHCGEKM